MPKEQLDNDHFTDEHCAKSEYLTERTTSSWMFSGRSFGRQSILLKGHLVNGRLADENLSGRIFDQKEISLQTLKHQKFDLECFLIKRQN